VSHPARVVVLGAVATLAGCEDPVSIIAIDNRDRQFAVFALNGTLATLPAGILVQEAIAVRIDANLGFDLAFDLKSADSIAVHTVGFVASQLTQPRRVGLQSTSASFSEATTAPISGYVYDSTLAVGIGQTVFVDVFDASCAGSILGQNIRGKLRVDSLDFANRTIYLHVLSNPNCGFKSLVVGTPKD
jgi:hypothetical protein